MTNKKITDLELADDFLETHNIPVDDSLATQRVTGAQVMAFRRANIRVSEGSGTTTLSSSDKKHQIFTLSAARTVKLPTSGIFAGEVFNITNTVATFPLSIQASDASAIASSIGTTVQIVALINTPVSSTDWLVINVFVINQKFTSYTPTIVGFGTSPAPTGVQAIYKRINDTLYLQAGFISGNSTGTTATFSLPTGLTIATNGISSSYFEYGRGTRDIGTGNAVKNYSVIALGGQTALSFSVREYVNAINPLTAQPGNNLLGTGDPFTFECPGIPIAEWS